MYTERSGSAAYQPLVQRATSGVELTTGFTELDEPRQRATQQRILNLGAWHLLSFAEVGATKHIALGY